jgi:hypothetical protein
MGPIDTQFDEMKQKYPAAALHKLGDGSAVITVPGVRLPNGWNKREVTVYFVSPVGYPVARPDCFWTDGDLRLQNGGVPKNTGTQPLPGINVPTLWFSWHAASWNANSDNLRTYLRLIENRLSRPE